MEQADRVRDAAVEHAALLLEEASVGDLVGQRVLEGVLQIGEEAPLVQELTCLEPREALPQVVAGKVHDRFEESGGDVLAAHRRRVPDPAFPRGGAGGRAAGEGARARTGDWVPWAGPGSADRRRVSP